MMHVDDWVDNNITRGVAENKYASFVLFHMGLSASHIMYFHEFMKEYPLYCTHNNERFKCTGASRVGDIFLARDFSREFGYDLRVEIDNVSDFGKEP